MNRKTIIKDKKTWLEFWGIPQEIVILKVWLPDSLSVKKLYTDLDYWIMINIGDDIVKAPEHRQEFKQLVDRAKRKNLATEDMPKAVRAMLKVEAQKPFYKQATFYWLLWLAARRKLSSLL